MPDYQEARIIAINYVKECQGKMTLSPRDSNVELVLMEDETIFKSFGWVFFYQSKKYIETGSMVDQLLGNAPIIVDKLNGKVIITGTSHSIDHYLLLYERQGFV